MLRQRRFENDLTLVTDDFTKPQAFVRQSFDALVANAVSSLRYFSGFSATKTGQVEVTVAPGYYWAGGPVFAREDQTVFNLLQGGAYVPTVGRRYVGIVTWGEDIETAAGERLYEIDDQGTREPRPFNSEQMRQARLSLVSGAISPDPRKPDIDVGFLPVAWVLLDANGVVSVEADEAYRLPSIESLKQLVVAIETWRAQVGQILNTIQTELVRIQAAIPPDNTALLLAMLERLEQLEGLVKQPASAVLSFIDKFVSLRDSDTAFAGYSARVGEGLTFAGGEAVYQALTLNNPLDPKVKRIGNILLPAFSSTAARLTIDNPDSSLSISQYTVQTVERVRKTLSRTVTSHTLLRPATDGLAGIAYARARQLQHMLKAGWEETRAWVERLFAQLKSLDAGAGVQRLAMNGPDGQPVTITYSGAASVTIGFSTRVTVEEAYWESVTVDATVTGSQVAQTFLNATNGWLTEIGVPFEMVASAGDVRVFVAEVEGGKPVAGTVISAGTIPVANLRTDREVRAQIEPVYLSGGRSYAVVFASTGNHFLKVRTGNKYISGSAFHLSDTGEWLPVQNSGDICMALYFAQFDQTRVEVLMQPLSRAGGIGEIRALLAQHVPEGTNLILEAQRAGTWYQFTEGEYGATVGNPMLLNLRAVFIGTRDLMPAIDMSQTEIELLGAVDAFQHFSMKRELDAPTDLVKVDYYVRGWDPEEHDLDCRLVLAGGTLKTADTLTVIADPQDETTVRIAASFTLTAASEYRVRTDGAKGDSDGAFIVTERRDHVF